MAQGAKGFNSIFAMKLDVSVSGMAEMIATINAAGPAGMVGARDAMVAKCQEIKRKASALAPDDPETGGLLKDSGRVYAPRTASLKPNKPIYCGVVFGGRKLEKRKGKRKYAAWALIQHEDLTLKHRRGQAKYLERPGNQVAPSIPGVIEQYIDEAIQKIAVEREKYAAIYDREANFKAIEQANRKDLRDAG